MMSDRCVAGVANADLANLTLSIHMTCSVLMVIEPPSGVKLMALTTTLSELWSSSESPKNGSAEVISGRAEVQLRSQVAGHNLLNEAKEGPRVPFQDEGQHMVSRGPHSMLLTSGAGRLFMQNTSLALHRPECSASRRSFSMPI